MLAAVAGAHGVSGEVRLKLFTDDLSPFRTLTGGGRSFAVFALRPAGATAIARLSGIADRTAAEALRGTLLTVPRDALPPLAEGEYYHADLIGLRAESDAGAAVGTVVAVDNFGAGDVVEIERPDGGRVMIPLTREAVPGWDEARLVVAGAYLEG